MNIHVTFVSSMSGVKGRRYLRVVFLSNLSPQMRVFKVVFRTYSLFDDINRKHHFSLGKLFDRSSFYRVIFLILTYPIQYRSCESVIDFRNNIELQPHCTCSTYRKSYV